MSVARGEGHRSSRLGQGLALGALALTLSTCATSQPSAAPPRFAVSGCRADAVDSADGRRRVALLVGVGRYKSGSIPTLSGPPGDVQRIHGLLTGKGGYGFPEENVCVLLDGDATVAGFRKAFEESLVGRVRKGDIAFLYYSGHGSTVEDVSGDEIGTGMDSTLVLHDSRTGGVHDLVDDEIYERLQALLARTENATAVFDSCHSGTVVRGDPTALVPRAVEPEKLTPAARAALAAEAKAKGSDKGTSYYHPPKLAGLVALSAAGDSEPAYELDGHGIFTDALLEALAAVGTTPLTYEQAQHVIRARVAARSRQTPFFHGALDTVVLSADKRTQPYGLRVTRVADPRATKVGDEITLSGPLLPGLGKNAMLRLFDGAASGPDATDPKSAKATALVIGTSGLVTRTRVTVAGPLMVKDQLVPVLEGDLAVLVQPSDEDIQLTVRLRKGQLGGGIPAVRAGAIRKAVADDAEARAMVRFIDDDTAKAAVELSLAADGHAQLRDGENRVRNDYDKEGEAQLIARSLWQHARQQALAQIQPETGSQLPEERTLKVSLEQEPEAKQSSCRSGEWIPGGPGQPTIAPLCGSYVTRVKNEGAKPLLVTALMLFGDGGIDVLSDELNAPLGPGKELKLWAVRAGPPLEVADRILVFGTLPANPVPWHLLAAPVDERARAKSTRGEDGLKSPLYQALARMIPGTRGEVLKPLPEEAPWTRSTARVVVRASAAGPERALRYACDEARKCGRPSP